ncbi:MAG: hypothetical protein QF441_05535 [Bacteriovoracaceae bacterium]|jgi:hypothetical protein|nr:hypothetical protein [Bacteriovoracaceae bacterium]|tara:strand:- start:216 stop:356 length:141 start_codon:yes stop_codon:yes gene_type:complete
MEALNLEMVSFLLLILGFGSALIHYSAFAKSKAAAKITKDYYHSRH